MGLIYSCEIRAEISLIKEILALLFFLYPFLAVAFVSSIRMLCIVLSVSSYCHVFCLASSEMQPKEPDLLPRPLNTNFGVACTEKNVERTNLNK